MSDEVRIDDIVIKDISFVKFYAEHYNKNQSAEKNMQRILALWYQSQTTPTVQPPSANPEVY